MKRTCAAARRAKYRASFATNCCAWGSAESALPVRDNELDAARYALDWARPGDVLALPLHSPAARAAVVSLLEP